MPEILILWWYETRNLFGRRRSLVYLVLWSLISAGLPLCACARLQVSGFRPDAGQLSGTIAAVRVACDNFVSYGPFLVYAAAAGCLLQTSIQQERIRRTVEATLILHGRPWSLVWSKALAILTVSSVAALSCVGGFLIVLNLFTPYSPVLPSTTSWVNALIGAPLLGLALSLASGLWCVSQPRPKPIQAVAFGLVSTLMLLILAGYYARPQLLSDGPPLWSQWYLLATMALMPVIGLLVRQLDVEKITLY